VDFVRRLDQHRNPVDVDGNNDSIPDEHVRAQHMTLDQFLTHLEVNFPSDTEPTPAVDYSREDVHVTYQKFRDVVYPRIRGKNVSLDAIVVSTPATLRRCFQSLLYF
jgi:hypothetical protein